MSFVFGFQIVYCQGGLFSVESKDSERKVVNTNHYYQIITINYTRVLCTCQVKWLEIKVDE
jgi:hypothetical protein